MLDNIGRNEENDNEEVGVGFGYPYTNFNEYNLDWIITEVQKYVNDKKGLTDKVNGIDTKLNQHITASGDISGIVTFTNNLIHTLDEVKKVLEVK